jgi:Tfp pilus assembly protein PilF
MYGLNWEIFIRQKEIKIAEQYFRNAFDLDTNNIHAQYILAYYYQESGELEKAIDQYNFLLLKEPNKNAFFNIGFIFLVYLQDYPQAIIYFQKHSIWMRIIIRHYSIWLIHWN